MASVSEALMELDVKEWTLIGTPTSEDEFKKSFKKITGTDSNGSAIISSDPKDFGTDWTKVSTKLKELNEAEPLKQLREARNTLLAETDFYALSDVTMSDEMKKYRQDLRDITKTFTSMKDKNFKFPTKP